MAKTIIVGGYGPGISTGVAEKFGAEGFQVALVARNQAKLTAGVDALQSRGIKAAGFSTDLGDPAAVRSLVGKVRSELGPITALHWNAYATQAGDLITADVASLQAVIDVAVISLLVAVQEALPDLKSQKGAVLVTNGGYAIVDPGVDAYAVNTGAMGLALANAAKHKMVGLLAERLRADGVYVGEVLVMGLVKGTPFDRGNATLSGADIAAKFWDLYQSRTEIRARVKG